jgi:hypothetical protein
VKATGEVQRKPLKLTSLSGAVRLLALALLVLRVLADHPHHTAAIDDLALVTDFLY